jgi:hypothetical protein
MSLHIGRQEGGCIPLEPRIAGWPRLAAQSGRLYHRATLAGATTSPLPRPPLVCWLGHAPRPSEQPKCGCFCVAQEGVGKSGKWEWWWCVCVCVLCVFSLISSLFSALTTSPFGGEVVGEVVEVVGLTTSPSATTSPTTSPCWWGSRQLRQASTTGSHDARPFSRRGRSHPAARAS